MKNKNKEKEIKTTGKPAAEKAEKKSGKGAGVLYDIASILITAALIITIIFAFFFRFSGVVGPSMEPTLHTGDWLILNQMKNSGPEYGDIVVISQPNEYKENIVKRVIATEGQTIDINFNTGDVYVDGAIIDEPYINNATTLSYDTDFPLVVPEGYCFVMGDNRQESLDSRSTQIGLIRNDYILGTADRAITSGGMTNLEISPVPATVKTTRPTQKSAKASKKAEEPAKTTTAKAAAGTTAKAADTTKTTAAKTTTGTTAATTKK